MMRLLPVLLFLAWPAFADERVENVFKVWDKNGDGVLTRDEIPDVVIFDKVDTDKDGKVSREEVAVFLGAPKPKKSDAADAKKKNKKKKKTKKKERKSEAALKKAPRTIKERVNDFFARFDLDKDKKIQKKEFRAGEAIFADWDRNKNEEWSRKETTRYIKAQVRTAKRNPRPDNFFDLFDLNRDKKVTRAEYDGPSAFFRNYDHNKNNAITLEELNMGPGAGTNMTMKKGDKKLMADGPTKAPRTGLLARYDKDKNGRITLKELGGAESVLHRLDKNGDGILSGSEVR